MLYFTIKPLITSVHYFFLSFVGFVYFLKVMAANDIQNKKRSKGRQCAAYGCLNFFYNNDGEKSGIHFFKFPDKNPEKQKWCNAIKRQDGKDGFKVSNNTFISVADLDISTRWCILFTFPSFIYRKNLFTARHG